MMKYFRLEEFDCPCCGRNAMQPEFLIQLDRARGLAGVPFRVNSGYRCEKHNREVGGEEDSSHRKGLAADVAVKDQYHRFSILYGLILAGFDRIGIGRTFVHVDGDDEKSSERTWLYDV